MRQLINILLTTFIIFIATNISFGAIKSGIEYKIPIDYNNLDEIECESKASFYYNLALKTNSGKINEDTTNALNLYTILNNKKPDNFVYPLRLGILYDLSGMDRLAKSNYHKAIGINENNPVPYFYLGEYYYKRCSYRRALKMYKESYAKGFNKNYDTLYKLGDIYEKFGDTQLALSYYKAASDISPNEVLTNKIKKLEILNDNNKVYNSTSKPRLK